MNRRTTRMLAILMMLILTLGVFSPTVFAAETEDPVAAVTAQLEAIDTLEQMQAKRSEYTLKSATGLENGTNLDHLAEHEAVRNEYEAYVTAMFSARSAAKAAYNALTDAQKGQIDSDLVAKLDDTLSTEYYGGTFSVSPRYDEYAFEVVSGGSDRTGFGYEVSPHRVNSEFPEIFVLVDTSDGKTSWTPSGLYKHGSSNYEVAYCCDFDTGLKWGTDYKRINLEDSTYFGPNAAKHIRAIMLNSYPYLSVEEMKSNLRRKGLSSEFVDSLTRADMISAVQMAIWTYANAAGGAANGLQYSSTMDVRSNLNKPWYDVLHEYTNELWDWLPVNGYKTYDARAAYRVNNLAHFLCTLPGKESDADDILITNIEIARAELTEHGDGYNVGVRIFLNTGSTSDKDNLKITVSSGQTQTSQSITSENVYEMTIYAKKGDTIKVTVDGTQYVGKNVYFYEPEGGREPSQNLVGVGEGETRVHAEQEFTFGGDIQKGLRIYKTSDDAKDGYPISDITFSIYKVTGAVEGSTPTEEELAQYKTAENKVGSVTTDGTGYASIELVDGTYLVVEEHNAKVVRPVDPFYITIPTTLDHVMVTNEDGSSAVEVQTFDILSIYPKNTPVTEPEPEPDLPPTPDDVEGTFAIVKTDAQDSSIKLEGAVFDVYRPATEGEDGIIITCEGIDYVAVKVGTLSTNANGFASMTVPAPGTYFLVETKAPDGYNLPEEAFKVTAVSNLITPETVTITNERGHILPETGGEGTTRLLMTGCILTAAALLMLADRKRRAFTK